MKGIISSHTALTAYERQRAVDPVAAPSSAKQPPKEGEAIRAGAARLSISDRARELADTAGEVNSAKVKALRAALESGTLKFDSSLVAEKMIDQGE